MTQLGPAPRRNRHSPDFAATPGPDPVPPRRPALSHVVSGEAPSSLPVLLDRAATSRANVLIEGGTEAHRLLIAQSIHARSWQRMGRELVCLAAEALPDQVSWPNLLAGHLSVLGRGVRPAMSVVPGSVGTLCLEGIDALPVESQRRLAAELQNRERIPAAGRPSYPRLIGGLNMRTAGAPPALDEQLEKYGFVVHVLLGGESVDARPDFWEAVRCGGRLLPKVRVEVW